MSDYPMLISNKLHSFRNFPLTMITNAFGVCLCLGALVGGKPTFLLSSIYVPNMYAICWG